MKHTHEEIKVDSHYGCGIFPNGKILSFDDGDDICFANKDFTKYGEYYDGEECETNFRQIMVDNDYSIYSVIDNKGKKYKIGDYVKSFSADEAKIKITRFYIRYGEIRYEGIDVKISGGKL